MYNPFLTLSTLLPFVSSVGIHLYHGNQHCHGGHTVCTDVKLGKCCIRGPGAAGDIRKATFGSAKFVNLLESEKGVIYITDGTDACAFNLKEVSGGTPLCASYEPPATGASVRSCLGCAKRDLAEVDFRDVVLSDLPCDGTVLPDKLVLADGEAFDIGPDIPIDVIEALHGYLLDNTTSTDVPLEFRKYRTSMKAW